MNRRVVLVTRPPPGLHETLCALERRGIVGVAAPLLVVRPLRPAIPDRIQATLLTSGQAAAPLAALAPALRHRPLLAVGSGTARHAAACGFTQIRSADGDAGDLARLAASRLDRAGAPVLLACGLGQGTPLATRLRADGFRVVRRCVYDAVPVQALPAAAVDVLAAPGLDAILFFSAETARTFVRLLPEALRFALAPVRALAISAAAAAPLAGLPFAAVLAAGAPTAEAVLALL